MGIKPTLIRFHFEYRSKSWARVFPTCQCTFEVWNKQTDLTSRTCLLFIFCCTCQSKAGLAYCWDTVQEGLNGTVALTIEGLIFELWWKKLSPRVKVSISIFQNCLKFHSPKRLVKLCITFSKYHWCHLCQISLQIMLLLVYTTTHKRFVIFTCRYFKLSWDTTALSQSDCRNFSCSSINFWIN